MLGLAFIPSLVVSAVIGVEGVFRSFTFNVNVDMVGFKSTICYLFSIFPMGSLFPTSTFSATFWIE